MYEVVIEENLIQVRVIVFIKLGNVSFTDRIPTRPLFGCFPGFWSTFRLPLRPQDVGNCLEELVQFWSFLEDLVQLWYSSSLRLWSFALSFTDSGVGLQLGVVAELLAAPLAPVVLLEVVHDLDVALLVPERGERVPAHLAHVLLSPLLT